MEVISSAPVLLCFLVCCLLVHCISAEAALEGPSKLPDVQLQLPNQPTVLACHVCAQGDMLVLQ